MVQSSASLQNPRDSNLLDEGSVAGQSQRESSRSDARLACIIFDLLSYCSDAHCKHNTVADLLPGLNKEFVARCISAHDLLNSDLLAVPCNAVELAQHAETILRFGFASLKADKVLIKRHVAHCVRSTPHAVVLRALNRIIRETTNIRPADRDTIVRRLHTILREGVHHRIYKFDIRSFFESLDTVQLFQKLSHHPTLPRSALIVLQNYLNELRTRGIVGLPRGIQLSATLSEFALQQFDQEVSLLPDVYFNARYVDDIVIITGAREDATQFSDTIKGLLPFGLTMNLKKTKQIDLPAPSKLNFAGRSAGEFDYLGYSFQIGHAIRNSENRFSRDVKISIADKKVRRMKSRICVAVSAYLSDHDSGLLMRRLQMLTGNYKVRDLSTGKERSVGLFCSYRQVNCEAALIQLDSFMRSILLGNRTRLARRFAATASITARRSLLKYSFVGSFRKRTFYHFRPFEHVKLRRCWQNV